MDAVEGFVGLCHFGYEGGEDVLDGVASLHDRGDVIFLLKRGHEVSEVVGDCQQMLAQIFVLLRQCFQHPFFEAHIVRQDGDIGGNIGTEPPRQGFSGVAALLGQKLAVLEPAVCVFDMQRILKRDLHEWLDAFPPGDGLLKGFEVEVIDGICEHLEKGLDGLFVDVGGLGFVVLYGLALFGCHLEVIGDVGDVNDALLVEGFLFFASEIENVENGVVGDVSLDFPAVVFGITFVGFVAVGADVDVGFVFSVCKITLEELQPLQYLPLQCLHLRRHIYNAEELLQLLPSDIAAVYMHHICRFHPKPKI